MKDFFQFDEDDDRRPFNEDSEEPTFSIHDFKKWLHQTGQGDDESLTLPESVDPLAGRKDELKEKFKARFKEKVANRRAKRKKS